MYDKAKTINNDNKDDQNDIKKQESEIERRDKKRQNGLLENYSKSDKLYREHNYVTDKKDTVVLLTP